MDLTEFMHGSEGLLEVCAGCGVTVRLEDSPASYEIDAYDPGLLQTLYPRYLHAFHAKANSYRPLLPARADVLEVGSHLGAFLQAAEEWGWRPRGFDIGRETTAFARSQGHSVFREAVEDARLTARSADAIFIWNCFEQLPDPRRVLGACYELVRPGGLLVVRVPNIEFYRRKRRERRRALPTAIRSLAFNNLLGFPYLTGYGPSSLSGLLERHGFSPIAGYNSTLLTVPYPRMSRRLAREIEITQSLWSAPTASDPRRLNAPWLEVVCRKAA